MAVFGRPDTAGTARRYSTALTGPETRSCRCRGGPSSQPIYFCNSSTGKKEAPAGEEKSAPGLTGELELLGLGSFLARQTNASGTRPQFYALPI
jgi:hypothetical protein